MGTKIEIKEEDPLSVDVASQNEREFSTKDVILKTNNDAVLLVSDCDVAIKTEVKSDTLFPDFDSQNKKEFLPEDPIMKLKKYHSDHEIESKIEIKVEPWWLETEPLSVCDTIKDGDFPPVKSSRLSMESVSGDSCVNLLFSSSEVTERDSSSDNGKLHLKCESQENNVTKVPAVEEHAHPKLSGKYSDGELYGRALYFKQNNVAHKGKMEHTCNICEKSFRYLSDLKRHESIHGNERPHMCKTCDKGFTLLSNLKKHNLIHEGKKPYQCKTCDKSFSQLSYLNKHNLIHEGRKPHQCITCDKSFNDMSNLNKHKLIHEGKKSHHCKICDKSFTQLSHLKTHNLIHEGKKPHRCKTCDKNFTRLSHLKRHNLIHQCQKVI